MNAAPVQREVALVGGGHTHALLIRAWGMDPLPGARLTLVSENALTPYSGMLPGLVAGHYTADEIHVDLRKLCAWAGVRFVEARMTGLDLDARTLAFEGERPPTGFDLLSLDTGSTPDLSVPGARERSVPVKPVHGFAARWHALSGRLARGEVPDAPLDVAVVGSGAGGFEIAMAMRHALPVEGCRMHWVLRGALPLGGRPERVGRMALDEARSAGVVVHERFDVERVDAGPVLVAVDGHGRVGRGEAPPCERAARPRPYRTIRSGPVRGPRPRAWRVLAALRPGADVHRLPLHRTRPSSAGAAPAALDGDEVSLQTLAARSACRTRPGRLSERGDSPVSAAGGGSRHPQTPPVPTSPRPTPQTGADTGREAGREGRYRELMERYLGPRVVEAFADDDVTEVYVNGDGRLRLDTHSRGKVLAGVRLRAARVEQFLHAVAAFHGDALHGGTPSVQAELPDETFGGARLQGFLSPLAEASCFVIRKRPLACSTSTATSRPA